MSKASEEELATLHGEVARALTMAVQAVPVKSEDGETVGVVHAPAAYMMAALTMLKNNNITADPSTNKDLQDLQESLSRRRQEAKGRMTKQTIDGVAAILERDLGGLMQ